jgi:hypothetical protein
MGKKSNTSTPSRAIKNIPKIEENRDSVRELH